MKKIGLTVNKAFDPEGIPQLSAKELAIAFPMKKKLTPWEQKVKDDYEKLNDKQRKAYDLAMSGRNLIITGSGGVGKTFLSKVII